MRGRRIVSLRVYTSGLTGNGGRERERETEAQEDVV
jgi:hypothetical protein